jgi:tetratricopeptide (TPR) repeat protein
MLGSAAGAAGFARIFGGGVRNASSRTGSAGFPHFGQVAPFCTSAAPHEGQAVIVRIIPDRALVPRRVLRGSRMSSTSKRLEFLQKQTAAGGASSADPFAWYGLAMELRALARHGEALEAFATLRSRFPDYVAAYLMCGQMLEKLGKAEEARGWFSAGIEAARKKGDGHALGELESALAAL